MAGATKILMGSGGVDLPSDDQFNRVDFLSHFDGANNGVNNAFDDGSDSNHTVAISGNPSQGTFSPFSRVEGEWSNYFDESGDYLTVATSSDFSFGTGNFTIECFVRFGVTTVGNGQGLFQLSNGYLNSTTRGPAVGADNSTGRWAIYHGTSYLLHGSIAPSISTWYHVAYVRNSGTTKLYVDGTEILSVSDSTDYTDTYFTIGGWHATGYLLNGYISNFRIVKGTAVYTSNFTAPTSALTAITHTKLLTCQSNRFADKSTSGHALTTQGTPRVITSIVPFLTSKVYKSGTNGASAFLRGYGIATSVDVTATGSDFSYGTGDFTIEGWYYREDTGASYPFVYSQGDMMQFYFNNNTGVFYWYIKDSQTGSQVLNSNTTLGNVRFEWNHWAVSRSGSNLSVFINGVRALTEASASNTFSAASGGGYKDLMRLGNYSTDTTNYPFGGYQSDFRILKGTALYDPTSSTCTVPTAPLTKITNTKLLLNMADGQVLDSAAQHNMSLVGNADSSTSDKKFGTASLALDGTGDGALVRGVQDFAGDFTIECWAKTPNTSAKFMWNVGQYKMECGITGNILRLWTGSYTSFFTGGEFTVDTWHHVAVVRNGDGTGNIKVYLDGTASSTTISDNQTYVATNNIFVIGGEWGSTSSIHTGGAWEGYIDELRISRYARYTSNFTPATEAFPDKGQ